MPSSEDSPPPASGSPSDKGGREAGRPTRKLADRPAEASLRRRLDEGRFAPGDLLVDRYRIVARLGRGGMGEVYRADDLKLGESVALKFLPEALAGDPTWLARLHEEVRVARQVTHPNVCRVHDIGEIDGEHFISMELIDGEDLKSLLRRIGRLAEDKAIDIARQLCAGLAAAHEKGVLHRDLKPANIMLDGRGQVRITDFGIAALAGEIDEAQMQAGTPAYMAPEQLAGEAATQRSDVYALGLVLYEIFTGKAALDADSIAEIERFHERGTPTTPSSVIEGIDPAIERVILRCLERDPRERPPSVMAVAAQLPGVDPLAAALAAGETPSPQMVAAAGKSEAMHPALAAAAVVLIAVGVVVLLPLKAKRAVYGYAPLDKAPAALLDRAKEVATRIGLTNEPADSAFGYTADWGYFVWSESRDDAPPREELLGQTRPVTTLFWYRQSPEKLRPYPTTWFPHGRIWWHNPPWAVPGEVYVSLDLAGRLDRFYVVPGERIVSPNRSEPPPTEQPDWESLFDLAGLDIEAFTATEPRYTFKFSVDRRVAWSGVYPESPDIPLQVEAGVSSGKPVYFRFISPWDDPVAGMAGDETLDQPALLKRLAEIFVADPYLIAVTVGLGLIGAAGFLAYRNRRLGRSDRRGAARLAVFVFIGSLLAIVAGGGRVGVEDPDDIVRLLAPPTFVAAVVWVSYLGLEPYVRRRWPTMLVAWTRVLSGRFRDPLVGKSVLIGAIGGIASALIFLLSSYWSVWFGAAPPSPKWAGFGGAVTLRLPMSEGLLVMPILLGFVHVLLLLALRYVLRVTWVASVVFVAIIPFLYVNDRSFDVLPWSYAAGVLWGGLILGLLVRFGVLAVVVCVFCDALLWLAPLTPDLSVWYAHATIVPLTVIGVLAVFGVYAATYRRPIVVAERAG